MEATAAPQTAVPGEAYPVKWPMGRVIAFSILSLGLYSFYWFYVTRKQVTQQVGGNDNAGLQTLGLIVPILNFVIAYWLWRDIGELRQRVGLSEMNVTLYMVLFVVGAIFFPPLVAVVYILVLQALNEYWDASTNGAAVNKPITSGEIAVTLAGFAFIALILIVAVVS
ncbi:MAG: DUF4234 domain-containing protein [Thermoleophilaceae bacterium]|nr:DUF4234 domain-containing protein [Thermoleophilaceae bacterium]